MKNRPICFTSKNSPSKYSIILLFLILVFTSSCISMQYGLDAQKTSRFSTFESLGIAKAEFIEQYGPPTNKGLYQRIPGHKVEKLYYTEKIKNFWVTTAFVFENDVLKQMERIDTDYNLPELQEHLEDIK